jgi:hypothetical protein
MNRSVWMAMALAAAVARCAAADEGQTITVTGCVQNFSAKGTVGTTAKGYLLTNATTGKTDDALALAPVPTQGTTAAGTPTGTSGTAAPGTPASGTSAATAGSAGAPPSASRMNNSFLLDGHDGELKEQVGRKVEITGMVRPRDADAPKGEEAHLVVSSIKMLSTSCSSR